MLISTILTILIIFGALQALAGGLVYVERKICAFMQNRIGPNRVGPVGLLQILADGLKFIMKEEFVPHYADKSVFIIAPAIGLVCAMLCFAVVPFGATDNPADADYITHYQFIIAKNVDIGILFIFAVSSLTVYGIILGGWASNNKYSLIGGLRSSAQIISYEIPLGLSILGVVLMTGSLNLERIIWKQASGGILEWNIWFQPLAFLLFMISSFAECNRLPFDLPETEQELVGGYHTEYNGMKLAFFFLGEYTHMVTSCFLMVILFFGGWHFPFIAEADMWWGLKLIVFVAKMALFIVFYMLVRWTIPRFRFDQLMSLAWKVLIPMTLLNLVAVMFVKEYGITPWVLLPVSLGILVGAGLIASQPESKESPLAA
ncbi:MAG: NADH-quinone oxidoreductase subunit NuoH [Planctomycetes bacterium]|nr:NADH-quinone oxidoreductase subunit NuoH [Planctomycetota bacterium]